MSVLAAPASAATNATSASAGPAPTFQVSDTEGDGDQLEIGWENTSDAYSGSDVIRVTSGGAATKDYALVTVPTSGATLDNETTLSFVGDQVGGNHTATDELWVYLNTDGDGTVDAVLYNHASAAETSDASGGYERATFRFNSSDDGWTRFYPENRSSSSVNISEYYGDSMTYAALGVGGPVTGPYTVDVRLDSMTLDGETLLDENPGTVKVRNGGPAFALATIQDGIDAATAGDTVLIQNGTYEEGRITIDVPDLTLAAAGDARPTIVADTDEVNNDAPGDESDDNKATLKTAADGVHISGLHIVRRVNPQDYQYVNESSWSDQNSKALGIKSSDVTVEDSIVEFIDESGGVDDTKSNAIWIANQFNSDAPAIRNVTIRDTRIIGDPTDTSDETSDDFRNGIAFFSLSSNGVHNITLINTTVEDANNGLLTGVYQDRGRVANVSIQSSKIVQTGTGINLGNLSGTFDANDNSFSENNIHLDARRTDSLNATDVYDIGFDDGTLADDANAYTNNTFDDHAWVVGEAGPDSPNFTAEEAIFGDLQTAENAANTSQGDAALVAFGEFGPLTVDTPGLVVRGPPRTAAYEGATATIDGVGTDRKAAVTFRTPGAIGYVTVRTGSGTQGVRVEGGVSNRTYILNNTFETTNGPAIYAKSTVKIAENDLDDSDPSGEDNAIRFDSANDSVVVGNTFDGFQHGVLVSDGTNVEISGNEFRNGSLDGVLLVNEKDAGGPLRNVTITENRFERTPYGVIVLQKGTDSVTGIEVHSNVFSNLSEDGLVTWKPTSNGVTVADLAEPVDARGNYWGSSDGPDAASNTYNESTQGVGVTGDVRFTPWLDAPAGNLTGPVHLSGTDRPYASVQAAVKAASAEDTVVLDAGTYHESVTVPATKPGLTIYGAPGATVIGDGVDTGDRPHAAIHVADTSANSAPNATDVTIRGLTVRNPNGTYGIFVGQGGSGANVSGLVVQNTTIERVGTGLAPSDTGYSGSPPLTGSVSAIGVRADYDGLTVQNNTIRHVYDPDDSPGRAAGISLSSFIGAKPAFGDQSVATDTLVRNNTISNVTSADRAKGISASGEFDRLAIVNNDVRDIDGSDGDALGITLTENPNGGDVDGDGNVDRAGPRNFTIVGNDIRAINASEPSALFIGGYEELGADHVVARNNFYDGAVNRYAGAQPGYEVGKGDTLNARYNYWGAANGPDGAISPPTNMANPPTLPEGDGVLVFTNGADADGNPVTGKVAVTPWLDAPAPGGNATAPVENVDQDSLHPTVRDALRSVEPGDTVVVRNGTYTESITISTRNVTLVGAGMNETVIDGVGPNTAAISVNASGVTIDSLGVRHPTGTTGIGFTSSETDNVTVVESRITDIGTRFNGTNDTVNSRDGIYVVNAENVRLIDNRITDVVSAGDSASQGIHLDQGGNGPAFAPRSVIIAENEIARLHSAKAAVAVHLNSPVRDVVVVDNDIHDVRAELGPNRSWAYSGGVQLSDAAGRVSLRNNDIRSVTSNDLAGTGVIISSSVPVEQVVVRRNRFGANDNALENKNASTVDARYNWWGSNAGPSVDRNTYNVSDQGGVIDEHTAGNVRFTPWLSAPDPDSEPFAPVVNPDSETTYPSIQAAVDAAEPGQTVAAVPGSFTESVTVRTRNLTLVGAGADRTTLATEETGTVATLRIARGAAGTTVRGLSVESSLQRVSRLDQSVSTATHNNDDLTAGIRVEANETAIRDVRVSSAQVGVFVSNANATANHTTATPGELRGVTVENARFDETGVGIAVVAAGESGLTQDVRLEDIDARQASVGVAVLGYSPAFDNETGTVEDVSVAESDLSSGDFGVYVGRGASDVEVHESDLSDNLEYGVLNEANGTVVDARGNYWGAPTGPGGNVTSPRGVPADGKGSNVSEGVLFVPYKPVAPAVGGVTSIDVPATGVVGEPVSISATVSNRRNESVEVTLPLAVNGRVVATQSVTVPAGGTGSVTFERTFDTSGNYRVSVGGVPPQPLTIKAAASLNISYSVADTTLLSSEPVRVTATVENTGGVPGTANLSLVVDGTTRTTRTVTAPANGTESVTFARYLDVGEHAVRINNFDPTSVTVEAATNLRADISVQSPADGAVLNSSDVTVEYTDLAGTRGIQNVSVRVDSGEARRLPLSQSSVTLQNLSEGRHTVTLSLIDNLGRTIAPTTVTFEVDTTKPTARLTTSGGDVLASAAEPGTVTVAGDDANLGSATLVVHEGTPDGPVVYRRDVTDEVRAGPTAVTYDATNASGELPSGEYELELRITDAAGNVNSSVVDLFVDNTRPTITDVEYGPDGKSLQSTGSVTVNESLLVSASLKSKSEFVGTVRIRLVSTEYSYASAPIRGREGTFDLNRSTAPADGTYAVRVVAVDQAGNSANETVDKIVVDRQAPNVGAALTQKNGTHAYVNLTASEALGEAPSATVRGPDGSTLTPTFDGPSDRSAVVELSGDGAYAVTVEAVDEAGNSDTATTSASFDTVTDTNRAAIVASDGSFVIVRMDEPVTSSALVTTGNASTPLAELSADRIVSGFLSGSFGQAIDANLTSATVGVPVNENALPPGVDPASVEIRRFNETTDAYEVTANETTVVDGSDPLVPANATADRYYVVNVSHFTVYSAGAQDTTKPTIDDTSVEADTSATGDPPEFPYGTDYVRTNVTYSDAQSGVNLSAVEVYYDGQEVTGDAATTVTTDYAVYNATDPASGQHNVTVVVVDKAGNRNSTAVKHSVAADTTGPTTDVSLSPAKPDDGTYAYGTDSVTVNVSYSDATSGIDTGAVRVTFDNGTTRDVTQEATVTGSYAEYTASGLDSGSYSVTVHVRDGAGNWNNRTVSFAVGADTAAPTVSDVTVTPANGNAIDATPGTRVKVGPGNESVRLAVTYADAASGVNRSAIEVAFDGDTITSAAAPTTNQAVFRATDLANGTNHTLSLTLVDRKDNSRTVTVPIRIGEPVTEQPQTQPSPQPAPGGPGDEDDAADVPAEPVARIGTPATDPINTLTDAVTFEIGTDRLQSIGITFASDASGSVTVEPVENIPSDTVPPEGRVVAAVDIQAPPAQTDARATVRFAVSTERLQALGASAESLRITHYDDAEGEWEALETTVEERTEDSVVLTAETPGFSLFAVTVAPGATPTPTTTTPAPTTTTPTPTTATPEPETTAPPETTTVVPEEPSGFRIPGFGPVVAIVALLVAALAAVRRANR